MRCFLALAIPESLRDQLASLQKGLAGTSWVAPDSFHITLSFLGDRPPHEVESIFDELAQISLPSFDLQIKGLGRFGSNRRTCVLWADIEPNPCLEALHQAITSRLNRLELEFEQKKFVPHITLSRHVGVGIDELAVFMENNSRFQCQPIEINDFYLMSSHRTSKGASYQIEAGFPLFQMMV